MSAVRAPTPAQRRAADPGSSVWVTANAGTGKTRVLADRVLRLLLGGADPEGIVCITFTKAAAAEMTGRIEERLAAWATAPDDALLAAELLETTGEPADAKRLERARRLFAQVLELPRGLGVMTIHALCGALLRRFPLEAGVAPHFETIDERSAGELMQEAREQVLRQAQDGGTALGLAMQGLAVTLAEATLGETLAELLGQRLRLLRCRAAFGDELEAMLAGIARALGTEPGHEPATLEAQACADGQYNAQGLLDAVQALAGGSDRDAERGRAIGVWLGAAPGDRLRLLPDYRRCFLKADGGGLQTLATKKVASEPVLQALRHEQARLVRLADQLRGLLLARRTEALLRVAFATIDAYEALKERSAALDYDDLIERARRLLQGPGAAEWVLFKLDARIEHVLVDEAQDTSPQQWEVILRLTEEFFAGEGAHQRPRTLFVVGDEKQSIYSFQGADLANFRRVRALLTSRAEAAQTPIRAELLDRSFRSVPAVLAAVDAVFALPEAQVGVVEAEDVLRHATERANAPGLVELWPMARPAAPDLQDEPWPLPDNPRPNDEPERRIARAIAGTVRRWLDRGEILESSGQKVRAGDILILLGRRGIVQELIIRALKQAGVPVAGADRLALSDHIAVQDLVALGRAMLLPEDNLNFACLLKSPLVGLDERALFDLAWNRGTAGLLERLRAAAKSEPGRFGPAYERIAGWQQRVDFAPPFEFYAWVLGADGGRRRMLARLGPDAIEPIEAFLGQTLAYEQGHPAAMESFLHWLGLGSDVLKRDPEQARDMVRIATVHGAKGLEAPIVFLADAGPRSRARRGRLLWSDPAADSTAVELPFWRAARADRESLTERIVGREAAAELEERRRLLYVALTRARDRLYVTGWLPRRAASAADGEADAAGAEPSWHDLVARCLAGFAEVEPVDPGLGEGFAGAGLRLRRGVAMAAPATAGPVQPVPTPLPVWAHLQVAVEPAPPRTLAPSQADTESEPAAGSPVGSDGVTRFRRGILVHRLLQLLPGLPPADRPAAAERLLAGLAGDLEAAMRSELADRVVALLARPDLQRLFGPGSRAEQPVCGVVAGYSILGQIDRLVVTELEVVLVDYKSNRTPPPTVETSPIAYLRQLAAYRALMVQLYPTKPVRAALLWTEAPRLDEVPAHLLDRHAPGAGPTA